MNHCYIQRIGFCLSVSGCDQLPRTTSMNFESLHAITTMVAAQREVEAVLKSVVDELIENSDLALARIWLSRPGDLCAQCHVRDECPDRTRCLHLVASAARPINPESGDQWHCTDGFYRRFPLGIRRIGSIGTTGESMMISDTAGDDAWFAKNNWLHLEGVKTFSGHPLIFRGEILGVLAVFSRTATNEQEFAWLRAFADNAAVAIANANAFEQIDKLKHQLTLENDYLRDEIRRTLSFDGMIGDSTALKKVMEQVDLVSSTDASVLILGESGVGKELIARAIHDHSPRSAHAMVKVNCASIPRELFESEFFGHVKGSFTGAIRDRAGRFELANGGTLFLDEVGEIPLDMQGKLLRVLQDGTYERIGEDKTRTTDVRVVAATNRDLEVEIKAKRFRQDLFYRLSVFPIDVVPLRNRKSDIPQLVAHFLQRLSRKMGIKQPQLKQRHILELQQYDWPGNIRELQNVVERAVIGARAGLLQFQLPRTDDPIDERGLNREISFSGELMTEDEMRKVERQNLFAVLERANWKVSGTGGAAEFLGMNPATLSSRMRAMNIARPRERGHHATP